MIIMKREEEKKTFRRSKRYSIRLYNALFKSRTVSAKSIERTDDDRTAFFSTVLGRRYIKNGGIQVSTLKILLNVPYLRIYTYLEKTNRTVKCLTNRRKVISRHRVFGIKYKAQAEGFF